MNSNYKPLLITLICASLVIGHVDGRSRLIRVKRNNVILLALGVKAIVVKALVIQNLLNQANINNQPPIVVANPRGSGGGSGRGGSGGSGSSGGVGLRRASSKNRKTVQANRNKPIVIYGTVVTTGKVNQGR